MTKGRSKKAGLLSLKTKSQSLVEVTGAFSGCFIERSLDREAE